MKINYFSDKSVQDLKEMFPNLNFLDTKFDSSVMGINTKNNRVIYHEWNMIHTLMKQNDEELYKTDPDTDEWGDFYDQCSDMVYSIEKYGSFSKNEFLQPKVCRDDDELYEYPCTRPT